MLLPKNDAEDRAMERFLESYNRTNGAYYKINQWLDRPPRSPQGPSPDCLCIDTHNCSEMVIERTTLADTQVLKLREGAAKFLREARTKLGSRLPGVFLLHDWGVNAIRFTAKNRRRQIAELCEEILAAAPNLADGEEVPLYDPFPVKLRKEEAWRVKTNSALVWVPPGGERSDSEHEIEQKLRKVLNEANSKFTSYTDKQTVLLMNIWETGRNYEEFQNELFEKIDLREHPNIKHIYLSEGLSDPPIYHLWSARDV